MRAFWTHCITEGLRVTAGVIWGSGDVLSRDRPVPVQPIGIQKFVTPHDVFDPIAPWTLGPHPPRRALDHPAKVIYNYGERTHTWLT